MVYIGLYENRKWKLKTQVVYYFKIICYILLLENENQKLKNKNRYRFLVCTYLSYEWKMKNENWKIKM